MWQGKPDNTNPTQGTANWFNDRCGKLTASRMKDAAARLKGGQQAKACVDYMVELVAERMTGEPQKHYVNEAMMRGIEQEPFALERYVQHTGNNVKQTGFFDHPSIQYFGASPDGLVGNDGLVEFKCPATTTHIKWMLDGAVPEEHKPQMLVQMACTGRKWCDFVSFDDRIKSKEKQLFIVRFSPSVDEIAAIEQEAIGFLEQVDVLFEQVNT